MCGAGGTGTKLLFPARPFYSACARPAPNRRRLRPALASDLVKQARAPARARSWAQQNGGCLCFPGSKALSKALFFCSHFCLIVPLCTALITAWHSACLRQLPAADDSRWHRALERCPRGRGDDPCVGAAPRGSLGHVQPSPWRQPSRPPSCNPPPSAWLSGSATVVPSAASSSLLPGPPWSPVPRGCSVPPRAPPTSTRHLAASDVWRQGRGRCN